MSRKNLPYRPIAECYLFYKGEIVAQDSGKYIKFPGGGIDDGENFIAAAKREVQEEIGGVIKKIEKVGEILWDWYPEWTEGIKKREERYKMFRGEAVNFLVGEIDSFGEATSTEGDAWKEKSTMKLANCINKIEKYMSDSKVHENIEPYNKMQLAILKTILNSNKNKIDVTLSRTISKKKSKSNNNKHIISTKKVSIKNTIKPLYKIRKMSKQKSKQKPKQKSKQKSKQKPKQKSKQKSKRKI
jgi:hypothetical protein